MKRLFNKKDIDPSKYVNTDTGETLASEHPNITSLNSYHKDLVLINYDNYVMIASSALAFVVANFNTSEVGRITEMTDMVRGSFNILHIDEDNHHTEESLMITIDYSRNKFHDFMKKLLHKGIIYYVIGYKDKAPVKYILLNPYLARKSKTIHKDCLRYFQKLK